MKNFYDGRELILCIPEDFYPWVKTKVANPDYITEVELNQFLENCSKFMAKLAKKYPNLEFEDLADIDTLTDIAAVKQHLIKGLSIK